MVLLLVDNSEGGLLTRELKRKLTLYDITYEVVQGGGQLRKGWKDYYDKVILSGGPKMLSDCQLCDIPTLGGCLRDADLAVNFQVLYEFPKAVLGICLGMQLMALAYGGRVERMPCGVQGPYLSRNGDMKHYYFHDMVSCVPCTFLRTEQRRFECVETDVCVSMRNVSGDRVGVQYHPEKSDLHVFVAFMHTPEAGTYN